MGLISRTEVTHPDGVTVIDEHYQFTAAEMSALDKVMRLRKASGAGMGCDCECTRCDIGYHCHEDEKGCWV